MAQLVGWSLPIAGHPQLSGDRSPLWTQIQIQIWKGLAPVSFWSCGVSLSSRVYKMKVVVSVLNRYFLSIGHDHRDRALAWMGCMALEGQCLAFSTYFWYQIISCDSIIFLKPHLNHPEQCLVTTASAKYM